MQCAWPSKQEQNSPCVGHQCPPVACAQPCVRTAARRFLGGFQREATKRLQFEQHVGDSRKSCLRIPVHITEATCIKIWLLLRVQTRIRQGVGFHVLHTVFLSIRNLVSAVHWETRTSHTQKSCDRSGRGTMSRLPTLIIFSRRMPLAGQRSLNR